MNSSLNPQDEAKFNSILQAHNYTPPAPKSQGQDWYSQVKANSKPVVQPEPSFGSRVTTDIKTAGSNVNDAITGQGQYKDQGVIQRGTGAVSEGVNAIGKVASEVLPAPVRGVINTVGNAAGGVVNWLGDKLGSTKLAQNFVTQHPDAAKTLESMAGTGANLGNIAGGILMADAGAKGLQAGYNKVVGTKPSITVGGKTMNIDQVHSSEGTAHMKTLSPQDQLAMTNFDHEQSLLQNIKTAEAAGKDTSDLKGMYQQMKSTQPATIEGSTAKINPGNEGLIGTVKNTVNDIKAGSEAKAIAKQAKGSIDAVNPDLTGKKLTNAYKQTVTGARETTPPSMFREQGLTPDQQTVNLGTRLQDLKLDKNPINNLKKLGTALKDTEGKITTALKGDPEINFNADKPTLIGNLEDIKKSLPREFSTIKDSKAAFNNVVDFAKQTINESEDSITGLRDARSAFDAQAKLEYPNAFKNGMIDVKTPAGRAIKSARDMINEHLYNTAPNGSEIQKLIGREADIFRATDNIAPKAAATHGQHIVTKVVNTVKEHPIMSAATAYGVDKIVKNTTGLGF